MLSSAKHVISAAGLLKFPPNGAANRPATRGPKLVKTRAPSLQNDTAVFAASAFNRAPGVSTPPASFDTLSARRPIARGWIMQSHWAGSDLPTFVTHLECSLTGERFPA